MSILAKYKNLKLTPEIPAQMDALMLSGRGFENLQLRKIPVPQPNADQLLARVDAVFACASDGKFIENGKDHSLLYGWDLEKWPVSIGHEGCITAVKVGQNLQKQIQVGDAFALQPAIKTGPVNHRERYRNNAAGVERIAIGYSLGGLFAEYILITEEALQTGSLIPYDNSRVPYYAAAICEPFSCVFSAQNHIPHIYKQEYASPREVRLGLRENGVTLIIGAGPLGMMHAEMGMMYHPRMIIISEPIAGRREDAVQILAVKARENNIELRIIQPDELPALLKEVNHGRGVDDCIVALGISKIQEAAINYLAPYGVANFFGGTPPKDSAITVDVRRIHYDNVSMVGTSGGDPSDVIAVIEMLTQRKIVPDQYVKRVGGLDQAFDLVKAVKNQEFFGKGLIYPHVRAKMMAVDQWTFADENRYLEQHLSE